MKTKKICNKCGMTYYTKHNCKIKKLVRSQGSQAGSYLHRLIKGKTM